MAVVKRDALARTELHRELKVTAETCYWCGGHRGEGVVRKLYEYWTESDSGRKNRYSGAFCGRSCFESYHCV